MPYCLPYADVMTMRYFGLTRRFPFLRVLFSQIIRKLLDFSDYRYVRSTVRRLDTERNIVSARVLSGPQIDRYHKEVLELL